MLFFCLIFCIQHKVCLRFICAIASGNNKLIQVLSQSNMYYNSTTAHHCPRPVQAHEPTAVLASQKALLSEEGRSMWSNVEVLRQIARNRPHTPGKVGRERAMAHAQWGFGGDKYTVNRRRHSLSTAT